MQRKRKQPTRSWQSDLMALAFFAVILGLAAIYAGHVALVHLDQSVCADATAQMYMKLHCDEVQR